ncbi:hypothetical protein FLONG3_7400 [Fusarium longipes]|uniref:Uncharacterized protein n=1 Tax=Fusarium longipes TaxID=694270 RepID=A0A395SDN1_9HYPO|nr:hypothetical protein FLONG3_7400 [Fusarium longipes]
MISNKAKKEKKDKKEGTKRIEALELLLSNVVLRYMLSEARFRLSAERVDVKSLLSLPEPDREDMDDNCSNAGVYVCVCHAEPEKDPHSGREGNIDHDSVGLIPARVSQNPDGTDVKERPFDLIRMIKRWRTIPELEEKAQIVSLNVPRFYRTVVEGGLEAHPRVVAVLPRDNQQGPVAMLIETVVMLVTGSVTSESNYGFTTQKMVADIERQLATKGRLKY